MTRSRKSTSGVEIGFVALRVLDSVVFFYVLVLNYTIRRRVSSVVEHSSANPKVPGLIPGPVSYWGHGL